MPRSGKGHKRSLESARARRAGDLVRHPEVPTQGPFASEPSAILLTIEVIGNVLVSLDKFWFREAIRFIGKIREDLLAILNADDIPEN